MEGDRRVKPVPFEYAAPRSLEEALGLLGEEAKPLAGGQSLVPLLNFRLARPELLVDINGLSELARIRRGDDGVLRLGALTRQSELERSELVAAEWPLLTQAVRLVGHPQIRNRGTVGGSVAHADPAAEVPVALAALGARFVARSPRGGRTLCAGDLFVGPLMTALEPDELLVEIEVPPVPEEAGCAFVEHARTAGDFAIAGAAAVVVPARHAAIALLGAGPVPVRASDAEGALVAGAEPREAAALAASHIGKGPRRALVAELVRRALEEAAR
jgi:CO/xanthine dehydrogenase FAD-binding subunit